MTDEVARIRYLSTDSAFGILTRPALELAMVAEPGDKSIYIIDFNNLRELNRQLGYVTVNALVRKSLDFLSPSTATYLYVGRVFSGDEIALVKSTSEDWSWIIGLLQDKCKQNGLGFKYAHQAHFQTTTVYEASEALDVMSRKLHEKIKFSKVL